MKDLGEGITIVKELSCGTEIILHLTRCWVAHSAVVSVSILIGPQDGSSLKINWFLDGRLSCLGGLS